MTAACRIRPETAADAAAVLAVHLAAFPTPLEARLVEALRRADKVVIALLAEAGNEVVGHIVFSDVTVEGTHRRGLGLAPVAVRPGQQRRGIGAALVREGLARARARGYDFVVVLGAPAYYHRFGFTTASRLGLDNEYAVDEPFMALALHAAGLAGASGLVRYQPEFSRA